MKHITILLLMALCAAPARTFHGFQDPAKTPPSNKVEGNPARQNREGAITVRVIGPDGQPMADAVVFAYRIDESSGPPHSAAAADDGNFKLTGLPPGIYGLEAHAPGYISAETSAETRIHRIGENVTIGMIKGGVITGRVTDEAGEPIVGVSVACYRLRDAEGRTTGSRSDGVDNRSGATDDRGIYRVYGLPPGAYVVNIGDGASEDDSQIRHDAPTYYPSATRDTAAEVNLRGAEEVSGIDIRHRGDRGHIVSGSVSGKIESPSSYGSVSVTLSAVNGGRAEIAVSTSDRGRFVFYDMPDGVYELTAALWGDGDETSSSARRLVSVRGADLSRIELKLAPHGSISGRVIIEASTTRGRCAINDGPAETSASGRIQEQVGRMSVVEEILLIAYPDDSDQRAQTPRLGPRDGDEAPPNKKGEFALKDLEAGRYQIGADLPDENWYIRAITQAASPKPIDVARAGITLKQGEKISGIEMIIAQGAASLSGKLVPSREGAQQPKRLRIHLIPAETADADDLLRYAEAPVRGDGSFEFKHIAPGKYLLHARQASEKEANDDQSRPLAWDAVERAKLRREAAAAKNEIELKVCERVKEHVLRW